MQDPRVIPEEFVNAKFGKKKSANQMAAAAKIKQGYKEGKEVYNLVGKVQKGSKRNMKMVSSPLPQFQETDRSTPDSLPDGSGSSDEYRALRRKYLLLEDESFSLKREMNDVDTEIKTLEEEKLGLLDQLVVLEGLVDPSEIQRKGGV